mmetsp:Transcript_610/g.1771  ORF Transcript_610/g.1771 Transcript_610/m.1771 type:complete len:328 (-) Transcript_610:1051-2034(-)
MVINMRERRNNIKDHHGVGWCSVVTFLGACTGLVSGWPDAHLDSREFKTAINEEFFREHSACQPNLSNTVTQAIILELVNAAQLVNATQDGIFTLKVGMPRLVEFYDAPGDCHLKSNSWILRIRKEENKDDWEGTLKSRSGDLYHTSYRRENMNQCCHDCVDLGGKFEEDLNIQWNSKFSHSHSCQMKLKSNEIKNLSSISDHWIEMEDEFSSLELSMDTPLEKVGDLSVVECVYNGFKLYFGTTGQAAKFSMTLWYESPTAASPSLTELSFKLKTPSKKKDWDKSTIMAVHQFWDNVRRLSFVDWDAPGKTDWVYRFHPDWCCDKR